jgi:hypothetical protein
MKLLIIFNTVTNVIILCVFIALLIKKHFHISVDRNIFTNKIEGITFWYNTAWFDDGSPCCAMGIFTLPLCITANTD